MLTNLLREDEAEGLRLVRRISAALASKEYLEAVEAVKPKPTPRRRGK